MDVCLPDYIRPARNVNTECLLFTHSVCYALPQEEKRGRSALVSFGFGAVVKLTVQ